MTHVGTAFLLAAFLLMHARTGTWNFEGIRAAAPAFAWFKKQSFCLFWPASA
jgi:formate hydrogenlyase subunit 3/multisubunit Na+/H+ antiporter MnhD subunit